MAGMTPQDAADAAAEAAQAAQLAAERAQALADQARLVADSSSSGLDPVFLQIVERIPKCGKTVQRKRYFRLV